MLSPIQEMLRTHPDGASREDVTLLTQCIEALARCASTCTSCADACLSETHVEDLRYCIRLNLDCAGVCAATQQIVARQTRPSKDLMRAQLQACMTACKVCGDECSRHAAMHEHCRICADACRDCEEACRRLIDVIPM